MIWKVLQVLSIVAIGIAWSNELIVSAQNQQQPDRGPTIALAAAATLGATLGALSVGLLEYSSEWVRHCRQGLPPRDFIIQKRHTWEKYLIMILGPAIGATAGIIAVSQIQGLEGNTAMAFVGSFTGVNAGLGAGCYLMRATRLDALEPIATVLPIGFAVFGALWQYDAQSKSSSRTSHQQTSSLLSMSLTLWSLRF